MAGTGRADTEEPLEAAASVLPAPSGIVSPALHVGTAV
jgi:hypothetical protein